MHREALRRKQRRRERQECPVHMFTTHGKEAQELRKGIEAIIAEHCGETGDHETAKEAMCDDLQKLLETVDARDSLAYLERLPVKP